MYFSTEVIIIILFFVGVLSVFAWAKYKEDGSLNVSFASTAIFVFIACFLFILNFLVSTGFVS